VSPFQFILAVLCAWRQREHEDMIAFLREDNEDNIEDAMSGLVRWVIACVLIGTISLAPARANEWVVLPLHSYVKGADVIVVGTAIGYGIGVRTVQVDRTFKGTPPSKIRLIRYVDGFLRAADQRDLLIGAQELMFLKRDGEFYEPLQTQFGRWPILGGRVQAPYPLPDYRRSITRLVQLQAYATRGTNQMLDACIDALKDHDPHVRFWAVEEPSRSFEEQFPPPRLINAYLKAWPTADAESRGVIGNMASRWKITRFAPVLAKSLHGGGDPDGRIPAARALGEFADLTFLPALYAASTSDPSAQVRDVAYHAIKDMLDRECVAAPSSDPNVRRALTLLTADIADDMKRVAAYCLGPRPR
jgi:hypothetical protein